MLDSNALVVQLNLFAGLEVVIDDHLLVAADQCSPDFYWRKPVDVDVCNRIPAEEQREKGSVLRLTREMAVARSRHRHWRAVEYVVHDRKIVDGKVPNNVYVLLEQTQVHSGRIIIAHFTERIGPNKLAQLTDCARVNERMIDSED